VQFVDLLQHLQHNLVSTIADLPSTSNTVRHWTRRYVNPYEQPLQNPPVATRTI
jgi:hypothetical protein